MNGGRHLEYVESPLGQKCDIWDARRCGWNLKMGNGLGGNNYSFINLRTGSNIDFQRITY